MKKLLLLVIFSHAYFSQAQSNFCGFEEFYSNQLKSNSELVQKDNDLRNLLYQQSNSHKLQAVVRTIPIVVHIIHENGPENISDSAVIAGVEQLNLQMRNISPFNYPNGADVEIEFCLASVDPAGNPTSGITRDLSPLTNLGASGGGVLDLYNINRWDPYLYLNVYIIRSTGVPNPGWSSFPTMLGSGIDGITLQYNVYSLFLVHEVGHWLGLHHTFYNLSFGTCKNFNCLLDGDEVCDTPPDVSDDPFVCTPNSCSTEMDDTSGVNPFIMDVDDVQNYMDYSQCSVSFTEGQSVRMNSVLTLVRDVLLQSNGCGQNPGGPIPVAAFTNAPACGGTFFTNTSINSVGGQWDFNGDGIVDESGNSITFNADSTGYYNVTLFAQGIGGIDTISQVVFMQHYPFQNYPLVNGFSGIGIAPVTGVVTACEGDTVKFQGVPGMASYIWSNGDTTQNTVFVQGTSPFTISLTTIDSSGLSWTTCYPIEVAAAPAPIPAIVSIASTDSVFCIGDTVNIDITYSPLFYSSNLLTSGGFIFNFNQTTYTATLSQSNYYYVFQTDLNGCLSTSNVVNITAQLPTNPANIVIAGTNTLLSPGGSFYQWYLDGSPIPGANASVYQMTQPGCYKVFYWWFGGEACGTFSTDSVCITSVGIDQISESNNVNIYADPSSSQIYITFQVEQLNCVVKLTDVLGREVQNVRFNGKQLILPGDHLKEGLYFINIKSGDDPDLTRKILWR